MGTAMAGFISDPFLHERLYKSECFTNWHGINLAMYIGTEDAGDLVDQMQTSLGNMYMYAGELDYASFNAEYAYQQLLMNQLTAMFFFEGIMDAEGPEDLVGLYEDYAGFQESLQQCLSGELSPG